MAIQDRTAEFRAAVSTLSKQKKRAVPPQQQRLLDGQDGSVGKPSRGEFARRAAEIGRSINATMAKLEKLASCEYGRRVLTGVMVGWGLICSG